MVALYCLTYFADYLGQSVEDDSIWFQQDDAPDNFVQNAMTSFALILFGMI